MKRIHGIFLATIGGAIAAVLILVAAHAAEPSFPPLTGRVIDDAGILSAPTREQVVAMLAEHERASGQQIVVVTLKSLQGLAIEEYGYRLGRYWGIGEKAKNTGALLIVAPNDRKVRIEVGYGLEGQLTDAISRSIIEQTILPAFRRGDFNGGVLDGAAAIVRALGGSPVASARASGGESGDVSGAVYVTFIVVLLWWIFVYTAMRRSAAMVGAGGTHRGGLWYAGGMMGGNWSSSGSSGGGGFSGGGGSFGGGGASGGW